MNMYSSKGHIKRLTGAFFLADIQTVTYTQVHRYLGHASMFLLTLHQTMPRSVAKSVIIEAWTFGYVAIIDSLTWHSILLMELMDIQHRILLIELIWTSWSSTGRLGDLLHARAMARLAAGKGRHAYIPIKMASGVQDITCVFVEVAGSYEKNFNLTVRVSYRIFRKGGGEPSHTPHLPGNSAYY